MLHPGGIPLDVSHPLYKQTLILSGGLPNARSDKHHTGFPKSKKWKLDGNAAIWLYHLIIKHNHLCMFVQQKNGDGQPSQANRHRSRHDELPPVVLLS